MDVENRRGVWNMISKAKKNRVILLTTHSMEEADVLSDRIAVMSHGRLQALGKSLELKQRYGSGYMLSFMLKPEGTRETVKDFIKANAPDAATFSKTDVDNVVTVQLPVSDDSKPLIDFFKLFEKHKEELKIDDVSLSLSTLEDVFLKLSMKHNPELLRNLLEDEEDKNSVVGKEGIERPAFVARDMGFATQFRALFGKSLAYQMTQRKSCCMIVFFPVFIMLSMVLLEAAVFATSRVETMCGDGVSREDCATKGYDLECVAELFTLTFPEAPEPKVGDINTVGKRGQGINANCDKYGCFHNLEKAKYRGIPVYSKRDDLGSVTYDNSSVQDQLKVWNFDLLYLLGNASCTETYSEHFSVSKVCENVSLAEMKECQSRVRGYVIAEEYLESNNGTDLNKAGFSRCLRSPEGTLLVPSEEELEYVAGKQAIRDECILDQYSRVWSHFLPDGDFDLATAVEQGRRYSSSGILGNFTTHHFTDAFVDTWGLTIVRFVMQKLAGDTRRRRLSASPKLSSLADLCTNPLYQSLVQEVIQQSHAPESPVLTSIHNVTNRTVYNFEDHTEKIYNNFCAYALNPDVIRGVSFQSEFASESELRLKGMFDQWGGELFQTDLMKATAGNLVQSQRYLQRSYLAHWQAYEVHDAKPYSVYNYTAFFNNSGSGGNRIGNWNALVWSFNNAVVRSETGRGIDMKVENMPREFKCNRDEYFAGETSNLSCDLLPRFLQLSILDFIGIQLFPYLLMVHMFVTVSLVVYEKENRLRMIMKMMGLSMRAYWIVNFVFYFIQYLLMVLMMWSMGIVADVQLFALHDSAVVAWFLFTWGVLLILFSFLLSIFFKSSRTCTAGVFLLMLILNTTGLELLSQLTSDPNTTEASFTLMNAIPPLLMIRVLLWMGLSGAFREQITMENLSTYGDGVVSHCINLMWVEIFVLIGLLWYLDNVLVIGYGVPKHPLFFLKRDYWVNNAKVQPQELSKISLPEKVESTEFSEDVTKEYERTLVSKDSSIVRVVRLHKKFNEKVAVKSVSFSIGKGEVFCMLGHNGAGKTTLFNMIAGLFPPTSGTCLVDGFSILTHLTNIYQRLGICPQHDILWLSLSGYQHLMFYGRLKGLKGKELKQAVYKALRDVNLIEACHRSAGSYSGGMRRRLSTAISLIGDPKLVILDECTAGLDPASVRSLVKVIRGMKGSKSILMTTHSMEEANCLADRCGIMTSLNGGMLQAVGTVSELKRKYGKGYTLSISTKEESEMLQLKIQEFIKGLFPSATLRNQQIAGMSNFEINREDVILSKAFEALENAKEEYGIDIWALSETTLEEVFMALHHKSYENRRVSNLGFIA